MDSHASLQNSKSIPLKVKANEVHAVDTSLRLFNKVDLQAFMKAGRWSSGGILTSYKYPREDQSPGGSCCGYFFITFQEGRPTGNYEGREVV